MNLSSMRLKPYIDFVDLGLPEPRIWGLEKKVAFIAPQAPKLNFDNVCKIIH